MYLHGKQHQFYKANSHKVTKQELEKNKKRIVALGKLIGAVFEDMCLGILRDDLFERMTANYEKSKKNGCKQLSKRNSGSPMQNRTTLTFGHFFPPFANAPAQRN